MTDREPINGAAKPRLYHAPSSYFSMIARLALAEAHIEHDEIVVDIHLRARQQSPEYARLNPRMTVPTLILPDRILDQSRDILRYALGVAGRENDAVTEAWVELHYAFPVEELTVGGLLAHNLVARALIPASLAASYRRLRRLAAANPDLSAAYERRAAVFAERARIFDPKRAARLYATRREQATGLLDRLDHHLTGGGAVMVPPNHGAADVVWTVFLARIAFVGMREDIERRPALARYWRAMKQRPSFAAADIWETLHIGRLVRGMLRA
jgi:tetrachloro-p-hydroquinone reductive dehalogenase